MSGGGGGGGGEARSVGVCVGVRGGCVGGAWGVGSARGRGGVGAWGPGGQLEVTPLRHHVLECCGTRTATSSTWSHSLAMTPSLLRSRYSMRSAAVPL